MNVGLKPLYVLEKDCRKLFERVMREVTAAGMQAVCSFDLEEVRSANPEFCCPLHGTYGCTCQLVILQLLPKGLGPMTMIMEEIEQKTTIFLDAGQGIPEEQVDPILISILIGAFFDDCGKGSDRVDKGNGIA